jgi:predicted SprT family Zn-dependent metalloprotease
MATETTLAFMGSTSGLPLEVARSLERWATLWDTPGLLEQTNLEWSSRLTRSLGRCYPEKRLVRLASELRNAEIPVLKEVLCHELAHIAVRELHSRRVKPHGPEWKALMEAAGFEPRVRFPTVGNGAPGKKTQRRALFAYVHRCLVCKRSRTTRQPMRQWRCAECAKSDLVSR